MKQKTDLHNAAKQNPKRFWDLIRKYRNKCKNNNNLTANDFYEHFKSLFSNDIIYSDPDVEQLVNHDVLGTVVNELDCDFSVDEVYTAIGNLKRQKSAGRTCQFQKYL